MTLTITYAWWWIPTLITVVGFIWALFIFDDGGGYLAGIGTMFALVPALFISTVAWIIAGALK